MNRRDENRCDACGVELPPITPEQEEAALAEMRVNEGELALGDRAVVCSDCYALVLAKTMPGVKPRTK